MLDSSSPVRNILYLSISFAEFLQHMTPWPIRLLFPSQLFRTNSIHSINGLLSTHCHRLRRYPNDEGREEKSRKLVQTFEMDPYRGLDCSVNNLDIIFPSNHSTQQRLVEWGTFVSFRNRYKSCQRYDTIHAFWLWSSSSLFHPLTIYSSLTSLFMTENSIVSPIITLRPNHSSTLPLLYIFLHVRTCYNDIRAAIHVLK